nr:MAG TPA: hypothetical protein [Caudoviricetes sp.]
MSRHPCKSPCSRHHSKHKCHHPLNSQMLLLPAQELSTVE